MNEYLGEFIGTMILMIFGSGVVAGVVLKGSKSENAGWFTICVAWGLGVAFAVFAVGSISGAHINPAVTVGLAAGGAFPWAKVPGYVLAQFLGAFTGSTIVWVHYRPHFPLTDDPAAKLAIFSTIPAVRSFPDNLVSEMTATFILLFGLSFVGVSHFADGLNPLVIGIYISVIGFSLGGTTGFAINPARDLGPRIAHFLLPIPGKGPSDWAYSWIPVLGPLIGGVYGVLFYNAVYKGETPPLFWIFAALVLLIYLYAIFYKKGKK